MSVLVLRRPRPLARFSEPFAAPRRAVRLFNLLRAARSVPDDPPPRLEEPLDEICGALGDALQPRALAEACKRDLLRVAEIIEEDMIHLLANRTIEHHQRRLVVQRQRAVIEVQRADRGPLAVYYERLRVQRRRLPFVDT